MTTISRRMAIYRSLHVFACSGLFTVTAEALNAAPFEEKEPTGLVWFIGTVEQVVEGIPLIDLGEVHTLRQGSIVAAVRNRDSHFAPLGLLEVNFSNPTWCEARKPTAFRAEVGDVVIFVKAAGDLGTGEAIQDAFVRHRIVTNANRNRYSTVRDSTESDTMQRLIEKQPGWVEGNRRIAGVVRSPSVNKDMSARLKPFMNQIMTFQDYQDQGVDVAQVTSESWKDVLDELRRKIEPADPATKGPVVEVVKESFEADSKVSAAALITVRRLVDESLFQRFPEERNVIAVICATLLQTKTSNERQWIGQQFAKSQFPALADQEQMLIDVEVVMRTLRKSLE